MDKILEIAAAVDGVLWGPWTMIFIAAVSLYLTVRGRFFQARRFGLIMRTTLGTIFRRGPRRNDAKMTPFQATATALASTVGMGSIAGVATALSVGGPGAIFWMWLLALISMITKTAEVTLAVHYRTIDADGRPRGGPMYYITRGLGWRPLAKLFSAGMFVNSVICATLLQSHTVGRAFLSSYGISPYLITTGMALVTAVVVIGGIKRIGRFCERLVPVMSLIYVLGGLALFVVNWAHIPEVFATIFRYALAPAPALGGFAGAAVMTAVKTGMARGMLSNEAGLGTAPMAHATADTDHPFHQGIWGAFEVFVVTFVICTITCFAVLSTGVLGGGESGIELVITAFASVFPPAAAQALLSFSILTFCLTTLIGFFIYFETSSTHLFGPRAMTVLRWLYLVPGIAFAGVADVDRLWAFANIAVGLCALPNLVAVLALSGVFFTLMRDWLSGDFRFTTSFTDAGSEPIRTAPGFRSGNSGGKAI